ncbi:hypothetical protein OA960_02690 [Pelagibacteraceae bacterium]|nr:hypothetical protein [Pelagibacteraceae bacterium]
MLNKNKILDCTLRDGGFTNNFNWTNSFVNDYFKVINSLPVEFVEVGYWKQENKSSNKFYNINETDLIKFKKNCKKKISIMNDFHYCIKNVKNYPKKNDNLLSLIRMTSRIENIDECVDFLNDLKNYTNLKISLNIFNFSNYKNLDFQKIISSIKKSQVDYLYFADTHGSIDFFKLDRSKNKFFNKIRSLKNIGFHFHDNIGTAYSNYKYCLSSKFNIFDTTICGIGRGGGNLRTELIYNNEKIYNFINKYNKILNIPFNMYWHISGSTSVSNLYANYAISKKLDISKFKLFCKKLKGRDKDNFNLSKIKNFFKK